MRTSLLLLALCSLLLSCGGQPTQPTVEQPALTTAQQIQQWLNQAQQSGSPQRETLRLQAAELLLQENQRALAEQVLAQLNPRPLNVEQFARFSLLKSRMLLKTGSFEETLAVLETQRLLDSIGSLPVRLQLDLNLLRAEVLDLLGNHIASAQQRIYINALLDESNQQSNRDGIWDSLMYVSRDEIKHYLRSSFHGEYQGWLKLAVIAKENQGDLDLQVEHLNQWLAQWPEHPAHQHLPGGLELIKELAANRPDQVALLLPLTGKLASFGKAVRDGFIAARYQTLNSGGKVPRLKVYDTESEADFISLYHQAVSDGAELVIGPLEKHRLRLLYDQVSLPVPTLALNQIDDYGQPPEQLFQFGLSPQDEARQIAQIAHLENRQQALIISPQGSWGDKVSDSFSQLWEELGGYIASRSTYSGQKDYSSSIKQNLLLQDSEDRAKRINRLIGEQAEFLPRRRQDVDMVLMLAGPQQARSLKPLLNYHYAGDLPVYGTSRLYTGYEDQQKNRDLNGVRFTDMPWVLNPPSGLLQQINHEIEDSNQYQRLYALGADSFQLHPRLRQLQEMENSRLYGQTGTLRLNNNREIERQLLFAQISRGKTRVIPMASQSVQLQLPPKPKLSSLDKLPERSTRSIPTNTTEGDSYEMETATQTQ